MRWSVRSFTVLILGLVGCSLALAPFVCGETIEDILLDAGVLTGCRLTLPPAGYQWHLDNLSTVDSWNSRELNYYYTMFYHDPWPDLTLTLAFGKEDHPVLVEDLSGMQSFNDAIVVEAGHTAQESASVTTRIWHTPVFWNSCFHYSRYRRGYTLNFRPRTITSGRYYHFDASSSSPASSGTGATSGTWSADSSGRTSRYSSGKWPRGYTPPSRYKQSSTSSSRKSSARTYSSSKSYRSPKVVYQPKKSSYKTKTYTSSPHKYKNTYEPASTNTSSSASGTSGSYSNSGRYSPSSRTTPYSSSSGSTNRYSSPVKSSGSYSSSSSVTYRSTGRTSRY